MIINIRSWFGIIREPSKRSISIVNHKLLIVNWLLLVKIADENLINRLDSGGEILLQNRQIYVVQHI